jgi:hypothetical protein
MPRALLPVVATFEGLVTSVMTRVTGVPAVSAADVFNNFTPRLLPIVDSVQPAELVAVSSEALLKFGTSVPAVAVQESPTSGSFEQKSTRTSAPPAVVELAGVNRTVYVTPVALGTELLIVILRVATCPGSALTLAGTNCPVSIMTNAPTNNTENTRAIDDRTACTSLTALSFFSFLLLNCSFLR